MNMANRKNSKTLNLNKILEKYRGTKNGNKKALWSLAALFVILGLVWGGDELYNYFVYKSLPKNISVAPSPLFEVEDYISTDISGVFKEHSMPKNGKLVITPYIESAGAHYYGTPIVYLGEYCEGEGIIVKYEQQTPISFHLQMLNPASHGKAYLYLHFEEYEDNRLVSTHDKKLERIWNISSLKKENEADKRIPRTINDIGWIFIFLAIVGVVVGIWFGGGSIAFILAAGALIIGLLLTIPTSVIISRIDSRYETRHSQYEKVQRLSDIQPKEKSEEIEDLEEFDEEDDIEEPVLIIPQGKK